MSIQQYAFVKFSFRSDWKRNIFILNKCKTIIGYFLRIKFKSDAIKQLYILVYIVHHILLERVNKKGFEYIGVLRCFSRKLVYFSAEAFSHHFFTSFSKQQGTSFSNTVGWVHYPER